MSNFLQDVRYALRMMARNPGFALVAVLTLALGIGANTTIFTWVDGFLLHGIPGVPDAGRLMVFSTDYRGTYMSLSSPDLEDFQARADKVDLVAMDMQPMSLKEGDEAERIYGCLVSSNYFAGLGVHPVLGRGFTPEEGKTPLTHPVVVISHALWQRKFAGDKNMAGRTITLNNTPFTVVGVAPEDFRGTYVGLAFDAYVPFQMHQKFMQGGSRLGQRGNHWFDALAKLKPGVSESEAQAQLRVISKQLSDAYPESNKDVVGQISPIWKAPYGATSVMGPVLIILTAIAGLVLLIACANVANLLLARASARRKEIAIRVSLGAGRGQLVRQLLTESMLLSSLGGLAALATAFWSWDLLLSFLPTADLPIALQQNGLNWKTMVYTFALSLATGLIFGLAPALAASRRDVVSTLKDETSGVVGGGKGRLRSSLVVAQVSLSLILLVSAGLLLRSLANANSLKTGFVAQGVWLGSMDLFPAGYTPDTGREFEKRLLERVSALPGVQIASLARRVPLGFGGNSSNSIEVEGYQPAKDEAPFASYNQVSPNYFRTMGIDILRGREFNAQDARNGQLVAVINEALAQRYWKDREALGGRIRFGDQWLTVVGIARTHKYNRLNEPPRPYLYLALDQYYRPDVTLQVKTAGDPAALTASVRAVFRGLDSTLPLFNITTLDNHILASTFTQRLGSYLLSGFGALALLLAAIGIYGVMSFSVAQRTREIGIRMALGAARGDILAMMMRQGAWLVGLGLAVGLVIALAAGGALKAILINVDARDPLTLGAVALLLGLVAMLASYLPARKAMGVDPLVALRHE